LGVFGIFLAEFLHKMESLLKDIHGVVIAFCLAALLTLLLHPPSRKDMSSFIFLRLAAHPWIPLLGLVLTLGWLLHAGAFRWVFYLQLSVIGFQMLRTRQIHHQESLRLDTAREVVEHIHHQMSAGFDLLTSSQLLTQHPNTRYHSLGQLFSHTRQIGTPQSSVIQQHPLILENPDLSRFMEILFQFISSGSRADNWIHRYLQFMRQKVVFRKQVKVKTTQVQIQAFMMIAISWMILFSICLLFPGTWVRILEEPLPTALVLSGSTLQNLGFAWMKIKLNTLGKVHL
jgi:Flp pilus assembly protein TadB